MRIGNLKIMDRRRKYTVEELEKYADRYISYFENKFSPSREAYYRLYDGGNSPGTVRPWDLRWTVGKLLFMHTANEHGTTSKA